MGWQTFSVSILGFAGQMVSIATTQPYHCHMIAATEQTGMIVFQYNFIYKNLLDLTSRL